MGFRNTFDELSASEFGMTRMEFGMTRRELMNTLTIDTSSNKEIRVALKINEEEKAMIQKINTQKAQVVLPLIDKLLKKYKMKPSDIDEIEVNTGPGSFTGLRVGISVANALSYALKIPVNKKKVGQFEQPRY